VTAANNLREEAPGCLRVIDAPCQFRDVSISRAVVADIIPEHLAAFHSQVAKLPSGRRRSNDSAGQFQAGMLDDAPEKGSRIAPKIMDAFPRGRHCRA